MQKINYYCDKCGKEINKENLIVKKIPVLERVEAKSGRSDAVLAVFSNLIMKEHELCKDCADTYDVLWNYHMGLIAQQWVNLDNLIKTT